MASASWSKYHLEHGSFRVSNMKKHPTPTRNAPRSVEHLMLRGHVPCTPYKQPSDDEWSSTSTLRSRGLALRPLRRRLMNSAPKPESQSAGCHDCHRAHRLSFLGLFVHGVDVDWDMCPHDVTKCPSLGLEGTFLRAYLTSWAFLTGA